MRPALCASYHHGLLHEYSNDVTWPYPSMRWRIFLSLWSVKWPLGPTPAAHTKAERLFTTSDKVGCQFSALECQIERFRFAPSGAIDTQKALRFQVAQAMAQVAPIVPQGLHELGIAGRHGAPGALLLGLELGQDTAL
jgi:hypothetical protein